MILILAILQFSLRPLSEISGNKRFRKVIIFLKTLLGFITSFLFFNPFFLSGSPGQWKVKFDEPPLFIENKGQFDGGINTPDKIQFMVEEGLSQIYFSSKGLVFLLKKKNKENIFEEDAERELKHKILSGKKWNDILREEELKRYETDTIFLTFENANPGAQMYAVESADEYFSYSFFQENAFKNINHIKGFRKIGIKNIYPKTDVEFSIHPQGGIKYHFILHPGGDAAMIKMQYLNSEKKWMDDKWKIHISTRFGDIIDHPPVSYYEKPVPKVIPTSFKLTNNVVSFFLAPYDKSKTLIIDPWIQTPVLPDLNCVWECETDKAGNVYIIGGDAPMKLLKYSPAGNLLWLYSSPWALPNWLGTLATDTAGNSFITSGSFGDLQKVDSAGNLIWWYPPNGMDEYWTIAFNCNQSKLMVGGTRLFGNFAPNECRGYLFEIDAVNGNILNELLVSYFHTIPTQGSPPTQTEEVRSISFSNNSYYFITLDSLYRINQDFNFCSGKPLFSVNDHYAFRYKSENYRPDVDAKSGIKAIKAAENFIYTTDGSTVQKRSKFDGTVLISAPIPGGIVMFNIQGLRVAGNSGIEADSCGNIFVGSGNALVKFDANLNLITQIPTSFAVYDVALGLNGEVIASGSTGTSTDSSRQGFIQSFSMNSCKTIEPICCNPAICTPEPTCVTASPFDLETATPGGIFSGPGITNNINGTFNPSLAGIGKHHVLYTLNCGSDSISITVYPCTPISACKDSNGFITASNGFAPYQWYKSKPSGISIQKESECVACGYLWDSITGICMLGAYPANYCYSVFWKPVGTNTVFLPDTFPILVVDNLNDSLVIGDVNSLPYCSCAVPQLSVSPVSTVCGQNNGQATALASGGITPYSYLWSNGDTAATIDSLSPGTYVVTVTGGMCNDTATAVITAESPFTASSPIAFTTCGYNNGVATVYPGGGTSPFTFLWSNGANVQLVSDLSPGPYYITITDFNGCTATTNTWVNGSAGVDAWIAATNSSCGNNDGSLNVNAFGGTAPYSYYWSNGSTSPNLTGLPAGIYSVTISDSIGCIKISNASVNSLSGLTATINSNPSSCSTNNGFANVVVSGGNGPYNYQWSNNQTTSTITGIGPGSYSVTITDNSGCVYTTYTTVGTYGSPVLSTILIPVTCFGDSNGQAILSVSGGSSPYSFLWNNGKTVSGLSGLAAGNYSATVTDGAGCTGTTNFVIPQPNEISISIIVKPAGCGENNGSLNAIASGGAFPYSYLWNTGQTFPFSDALAAGEYEITITDANNCTKTATAFLSDTSAPVLSLFSENPSCYGYGDGFGSVNATGGTSPYMYQWSNNSSIPLNNGLTAGTYFVTVADDSGCKAVSSITLTDPTKVPAKISTSDSLVCWGGSAAISAGGGQNFLWSTGEITQNIIINNIHSDSLIFVTVTDSTGCSGIDSIRIKKVVSDVTISCTDPLICPGELALLVASGADNFFWSNSETNDSIRVSPVFDKQYYVEGKSFLCLSWDTILIKVNKGINAVISNDTLIERGTTITLGATGGDSFLWSTGETSASIKVGPEEDTYYTVEISDSLGCIKIDTILITVEGCRNSISIPTIFSPNGDGQNDFIKVYGNGIEEINLLIYDRLGNRIFETSDKNQRWDGTFGGKLLNAGVFVYCLKASMCNGKTHKEKGNITLVR